MTTSYTAPQTISHIQSRFRPCSPSYVTFSDIRYPYASLSPEGPLRSLLGPPPTLRKSIPGNPNYLTHLSYLHACSPSILGDPPTLSPILPVSVSSSNHKLATHHAKSNNGKRNHPTSVSPNPSSTGTSLLNPRTGFKLAAFNVRTLKKIGQQAALALTLESLKVDICCLSETRIQDSSTTLVFPSPLPTSTAKFHVHLSGDSAAAAVGRAGVGFALSTRAENALIDWIPVNSRLCAIRLHGSFNKAKQKTSRTLFIIAAYAPTNCSTDTDKDEFYQQLTLLLQRKRRTDIVVSAGDFNAQIGSIDANERHVAGTHAYGADRTDNGERLIHFCSDTGMFLASTNFSHPNRQRATWRPPVPGQRWKQLDHIAIYQRWRGSISNCRSIWNTHVDSDHAMVLADFSLRFGGKRKHVRKHLHTARLADPKVLHHFQSCLTSELSKDHPTDVEGHWSHIREALKKASSEACGFTKRIMDKWISNRSLDILQSLHDTPPDSAHSTTRRNNRKQLREQLKQDRECWWKEQAADMERAAFAGNTRKLFQLIRSTGGRKCGVSETIRETDGQLIHEQERRLIRWSEHFQQQFNCPPPTMIRQCPPGQTWSVDCSAPSTNELLRELKNLKRHKASGPDDLPPSLFKDGGPTLVSQLNSLLQHIWLEEVIPTDWGAATVVPVFKKGDRSECANHRGISLIAIASKLLVSIMVRRLTPLREQNIREEQSGFRPNRGCIDHIFTLRQLLELRHTFNRPTIVVFLDIRGAFDSVNRETLWDYVSQYGMPGKYVNLFKALYSTTTGQVRAYGSLSPQFDISSGVRQGCPASPFLFNFVIDAILQNALNGSHLEGVELLPGSRITDLEYADDIALLCEDTIYIYIYIVTEDSVPQNMDWYKHKEERKM